MSEHTTQATLTRREREKLARQQDIVKAALELFAAKGFRDTTLDEIAQKAEFGKGTLYNYFASKEDIFHAIIDQAINDSISIARACAAETGSTRSRITAYARSMMRYIRGNGELLHVIFQELHGRRESNQARIIEILDRSRVVTGTIAALLQEDIDRGVLIQGDPAKYISLLDDMLRGYASKQMFLGGGLTDAEIDGAADTIVGVLFDGITARNSRG